MMIGNVTVRTGPGAEPISLLEAKNHCSIDADITGDDALVAALISAARAYVEKETNSAVITQGLRSAFPHFTHHCFNGRYTFDAPAYGDEFSRHVTDRKAKAMRLRGPVRKVDTISYLDENKAVQTLDASIYDVDLSEPSGSVSLAYGKIWPVTYIHPAAVSVNFTAGYATPFTVDTATNILTAAGHPYAAGDVLQLQNSGGALPAGMAANTNYYAVGVAGDSLQLSATLGGAAIDITGAGTGTHFAGIVPAPIRQAMLLLIGHWYAHRESVSDFQSYAAPQAVDMLLAPYKAWGY